MESNSYGVELPHRNHPVIRRDYAVFTPPMEAMINTIGDWIEQQVTGGMSTAHRAMENRAPSNGSCVQS